jgi:hydroxymethylpyrimidine pyrophosphatase-like HAD family hydrolase
VSAVELTDLDRPAAASTNEDGSFEHVNLLDDLQGLSRRLTASLASGDWLDSFLFAAGMNQVAEDFLHRDVVMLARVKTVLARQPSRVASVARTAADSARRAGLGLRERRPEERSVRLWQDKLALLTQALADRVAGIPGKADVGELDSYAAAVLGRLPSLPRALRCRILQMPTCFQSLDQRPSDCGLLVDGFADRWPDRGRAVRVLGLRTSGSYLAPLVAAYLKGAGYREVQAWTMRPGQDMHREERDRLRSVVLSDALLVMIDDPPKTGKSLAIAAQRLELSGLPRERIVMLAPLTGPMSAVPELLRSYQTLVLPWPRWSIHERLRPEVVKLDLDRLLEGRDVAVVGPGGDRERMKVCAVTSIQSLAVPPIGDLKGGSPVRRHVRAVFEVSLRDGLGREVRHHVYAKGAGLGYFGRHSLTVARALEEFVPDTYGLSDGLLFRAWAPEGARIRRPEAVPGMADRVAAYILARRAKLAVPTDISERLVGLNPVWQRVADIIAASFGRARSLVRPLTHRAALRLLQVARPSVIDGSMAVCQWFGDPLTPSGLLKVDYDERAYSNQDTVVDQLYSFDPVFDLAAAATDLQLSGGDDEGVKLAATLRDAFETVAGRVSDERWLLYQLLVLKSYRQFLESMRSELDERTYHELATDTMPLLEPSALADEIDRLCDLMAQLDRRYLCGLFLSDLRPSGDGALCAIDIDGVLETDHLGYSSVTPLGALGLRSLVAHGFRPILATGRSVKEVRDRCRALGLAGGVAEYGAAFYDLRSDRVHELLTNEHRDDLEQLRAALAAVESMHIASGYRRAVRASLISDGERRPVPRSMVQSILDECGLDGRVRAVHGWAQTDFMVAGVDKGSGLKALLQALDPRSPGKFQDSLALAVGDGAEDVPMLAMANVRVAPANAEPAIASIGARVVRRRHQGGLAQGIELLIGHRPGGCVLCRPAATAGDAGILLTALKAQEDGRLRKLRQAARLASLVVGR